MERDVDSSGRGTKMKAGAGARTRRVLVINPNTNPAVTALVRRAAERVGRPGVATTVINPAHGPFSIETEEERAAAEAELLPLIVRHARDGFDAIVLACFDDIGLGAARLLTPAPVIGACEAGIAAANATGRRFAVVTTVESAVPTIRALLARYGAPGRPVRAAGIGVAAAASDDAASTKRLRAAVQAAIQKDGAEVILLGSGGLTGRAPVLAEEFAVPVIDAVAVAMERAVRD